MDNFRYIPEPYKGMSTRFTCPQCNKRREYTRYIDTRTGEYLPNEYGICNRKGKCGYHLSPYHDGYSQRIWDQEKGEFKTSRNHTKLLYTKKQQPVKEKSFIASGIFKQTLLIGSDIDKIADNNHFVKYLIALFGVDITAGLVSRYFIGTSKHWQGATIFWQIDITGKIRTGKIMLYSPITGKRIKEPYKHGHIRP